MHSLKQRGIVLLTTGFMMPLMFLIGGGFISATNGAQLAIVFGLGLLSGWSLIGPWIYESVRTTRTKSDEKTPPGVHLVGALVFVLSIVGWPMFFRSELFLSAWVQEVFAFVMGLGIAPLAPLGLGLLRASADESQKLEPVAALVSNQENRSSRRD
jgi:hypothetical protein